MVSGEEGIIHVAIIWQDSFCYLILDKAQQWTLKSSEQHHPEG